MTLSARTTLVTLPSPLEGEGRNEFPRVMMGEGSKPIDMLYPSPIIALSNVRLALSLKGRGRNDSRPQGRLR